VKIAMASDHGGFELKEILKKHLLSLSYDVIDFGCFCEESVDYPDYIKQAALSVSKQETEKAVVVCGSGVGASIVANKIPGVRAVLCTSEYLAEYSRLHNNANVIAFGGRITTEDLAKRYLGIWLTTEYEAGRHQKRLDKITAVEKNPYFEESQ